MEEGTMPRMNGVEATQRLKTCCPDLPVIIPTVHLDPVYERIAMAAGADGYLLKKTAGTAVWPALVPLAARGGRSGPGRAITVFRAPVAEARQEFGRASVREPTRRVFRDRPDWQLLPNPARRKGEGYAAAPAGLMREQPLFDT